VCICFASYRFRSKNKFCRTVGFRLKTREDLGLLGCCTKWQGDPFQKFWRNVFCSPLRNCVFFYDILTLQDGGSTFLWNAGNGYPCSSVQGPRHLNPKHKASTLLNGWLTVMRTSNLGIRKQVYFICDSFTMKVHIMMKVLK